MAGNRILQCISASVVAHKSSWLSEKSLIANMTYGKNSSVQFHVKLFLVINTKWPIKMVTCHFDELFEGAFAGRLFLSCLISL